jgi:IS4 transposase
MHFTSSIFAKLLEPISRRGFQALVDRHNADAYDKGFHSYDHLLTLVFAQLSGINSLRGLEVAWNANANQHYHLGTGKIARSTVSDANGRRPPIVFAELFAELAAGLDHQTRCEGRQMLRLIDSTPIPLGKLCAWAKSNGRIRGMKMHVLYDPHADAPRIIDITDANVNDAQVGRSIKIESGATYVFDKGYVHYGWWRAIDAAGSSFITRNKTSMRLEVVRSRPIRRKRGDGFTVLEDAEVRFASKGDSKLPIRLRRLLVKRDTGGTLTLITNDMHRSAVEIAAFYKARWQIELLFRWIKQHLRIRKFLGNNDNAIRLQLFAAMIAYALLRIAARVHKIKTPILRFVDLVCRYLLARRDIAAIEKPPPINPSKRQSNKVIGQAELAFA